MMICSTLLPSPFGTLTVTVASDGVCALSFEGAMEDSGRDSSLGALRLANHINVYDLTSRYKEEHALKAAAESLQRYFDGSEQEFTLPLAPSGTPFQQAVWRLLRYIPYGETRSYGWVAKQLGMRCGARAVGGACGRNPIPIIIPCHRVIASNGNIGGYSGGGAGEGISIKRGLLALEGITVCSPLG